jgi:hypothetical protein
MKGKKYLRRVSYVARHYRGCMSNLSEFSFNIAHNEIISIMSKSRMSNWYRPFNSQNALNRGWRQITLNNLRQ